MNVYQKLQAARIKLSQIEIKKSGHNKFSNYTYFELGDFLQPIQKIFDELGLCGVTTFYHDVATMMVVNTENPEEYITFQSPMGTAALKGCHEVQNIGAVETYQRRYLYLVALEIVEHDALDATTGKESLTKPAIKQVDKPQPSPAKLVAMDADISDEDKADMDVISLEINNSFESGDNSTAIELYRALDDDEHKKYIWPKLGSRVRAYIKSQGAPK